MSSDSKNSGSSSTTYTKPLTAEQAEKLRRILLERGWQFEARPYTLYFAKREKVSVSVYEKGPKIVVQGKGMDEFLEFILEPEVIGVDSPDADEVEHPEWFSPHLGIDESGKGDFFGPLVIAGAYVDGEIARAWREAGVMDSKAISSDSRIRSLARVIRGTAGAVVSVVVVTPKKYNELYASFANLNRLLAWGHARVIENLLEMRPDCPRALSDQFANPSLIRKALMERGRGIQLDQQTKAESDPAVAAASILAREGFINWLDSEGRALGVTLPKGASALVKKMGQEIVTKNGREVLQRVAKVHFKTANEILANFETSGLQGAPEDT